MGWTIFAGAVATLAVAAVVALSSTLVLAMIFWEAWWIYPLLNLIARTDLGIPFLDFVMGVMLIRVLTSQHQLRPKRSEKAKRRGDHWGEWWATRLIGPPVVWLAISVLLWWRG